MQGWTDDMEWWVRMPQGKRKAEYIQHAAYSIDDKHCSPSDSGPMLVLAVRPPSTTAAICNAR